MTPTAAELREALEKAIRLLDAATPDARDPSLRRGWGRDRKGVRADLRLLADILEQGEEIEWCDAHDASIVEELGGCGGANIDDPCRMVPSLRIPSAVLDPAKNEEEFWFPEALTDPNEEVDRDQRNEVWTRWGWKPDTFWWFLVNKVAGPEEEM